VTKSTGVVIGVLVLVLIDATIFIVELLQSIDK
jgi:hypothetical protein